MSTPFPPPPRRPDSSAGPGDGFVGLAAGLAAAVGYVAFGHVWPAFLIGACGAAAGSALVAVARALARHVYRPLRRGLAAGTRRVSRWRDSAAAGL